MAHVVEGANQEDCTGDIQEEWHIHQLKTTSDFARNNKLLSWYVGGLNFQIEHHLFPGICHIHYKQLAPIVQETARAYNIPYNLKPSFRAALVSHIERLKELGVK
jgi:linoleoyl-CoA desaturase